MSKYFSIILITVVFPLVCPQVTAQSCCAGDRGNINLQGQADLSDLSLLIGYLVLPGAPALPCPEAADLNYSQTIDLSDLSIFILAISNGYPKMPPCEYGEPSGNDYSYSSCMHSIEAEQKHDLLSCLQWYYDGYSRLWLMHNGAQFNCCLDHIQLSYQFSADTIFVIEQEMYGPNGPCNCLCTYNVDIRLNNIRPGTYQVYLGVPREPISHQKRVIVDLLAGPSGVYCW